LKQFEEAFENFTSLEQRKVQGVIDGKGGIPKLKNDDKALEQLIQETKHIREKGEDRLRPSAMLDIHGSSDGMDAQPSGNSDARNIDKPPSVKDLRSEWGEDIATLLDKNMETFRNTFELQRQLINEDLSKIVTRGTDRVIQEVQAGPHDRIKDEDIYTIWKNMVGISFLFFFLFSGATHLLTGGRDGRGA
jgi:hypothetical protein